MHKNMRQKTLAALSAVVGAMVAGGFTVHAQTDTTTTTTNKLEQENQELRKRVDNLEHILEKEGLKTSAAGVMAKSTRRWVL